LTSQSRETNQPSMAALTDSLAASWVVNGAGLDSGMDSGWVIVGLLVR